MELRYKSKDGCPILTEGKIEKFVNDNKILVAGHTDPVPTTGTVWPTNWELSTARATATLRVLNESYGLPGPRLSAVGHADTRPRATNETPEGRQQNRRTEIVVLVEPDTATVSEIPLVEGGENAGDEGEGGTPAEGTETIPDIVGFENPVFASD